MFLHDRESIGPWNTWCDIVVALRGRCSGLHIDHRFHESRPVAYVGETTGNLLSERLFVDECVCSHFSAGQVLVCWRVIGCGGICLLDHLGNQAGLVKDACLSYCSLPFSRIYRTSGQCGVGGGYNIPTLLFQKLDQGRIQGRGPGAPTHAGKGPIL